MNAIARGIFSWLLISPLLFVGLAAQPQQVSLVRLNQDVQLLADQVNRLRLNMEQLNRRNEQLEKTLQEHMKRQQDLVESQRELSADLSRQMNRMDERERQLKRDIISQVTRQIEALAEETQKGLDALARVQGARPAAATEVTFSDDFPSQGVSYVVQPGDTLSTIARRHNSTVRDIQNANRISDPRRDLRAGQTIFVPQRDP